MQRFILLLLTLFVYISVADATQGSVFPITEFSSEELEQGIVNGWELKKGFCRKIKYRTKPSIMEIDNRKTLYANVNDSGVIALKPVKLPPLEYKFLKWEWKVSKILPNSIEKEKGADDYPASICIVYGKTLFGMPYRYRALIYVFGNNIQKGERFANPCKKNARMIVVESGKENVNKWLNYKVNHYSDYIQEFGQEPGEIIYVGIQTNTDRTHEKIETWYANIFLETE